MSQRIPAEVFPPGEFLREELETRGWTQADLAELMGRPLRSINEIINGKKAITAETAIGLGDAFGTSAEYWMNLESLYRLHVAGNMQAIEAFQIHPILGTGSEGVSESDGGFSRNCLLAVDDLVDRPKGPPHELR